MAKLKQPGKPPQARHGKKSRASRHDKRNRLARPNSERRRTAASWLRAAGVQDDWDRFYECLQSVGKNAASLMLPLVQVIVRKFDPGEGGFWKIAIDDSPTRRFGPCVEAANVHHNPTPGPADGPRLYGHNDVKEVWGAGEQQVRNLWSNIGCWNLCTWLYALVELECWDASKTDLVDRSNRPWDNPDRRPSHADRRRQIARKILRDEFFADLPADAQQTKIRERFERLLSLAACPAAR